LYNEETELYRIDYVDGDWEEMNCKQVKKFKCLDTEKDQMKRFTRSSLHQQANAVKHHAPTVPPLPPHYTMAVFDEASGKMLDYRQLTGFRTRKLEKSGNIQCQMNLVEQCME
jgi:hypothetical protein